MTEKRRLATAAAAMKERIITFRSVLVLWLLPTEARESSGPEPDVAAMVASSRDARDGAVTSTELLAMSSEGWTV
jgi:hypothetical protein